MNALANETPHVPPNPPAAPTGLVSPTRSFYWSVRRELWENGSIYLAPLAVSVLFFFGFIVSTIGMPARRSAVLLLDPMKQQAAISQPYDFAALLIMFVTTVVGVFYCLDALNGERRDRSILFWKSLPVSDLTTVLSKASIPLLVLPLVGFAITVATQFVMMLWSSVVLFSSGLASTTWTRFNVVQQALLLLYHLLTVHALWYAPFYGWFLLVSSWARRAAVLWAALPLLAIGIVEKIAFNTTRFARLLGNRVNGGPEAVMMPGVLPMNPMTHPTPGHFLASPGLWIGLAIAAVFLAGAVRLRRYREPM